ncbi:unnamed protein product [Polarella glacialis]|uniref:Uncharacterized protein n=1 Tax=Polarella glacialis TaxID=89957 RepID=A0A813DCV3_POLGL|nr:unnamed protein product [Polarella glacialis]
MPPAWLEGSAAWPSLLGELRSALLGGRPKVRSCGESMFSTEHLCCMLENLAEGCFAAPELLQDVVGLMTASLSARLEECPGLEAGVLAGVMSRRCWALPHGLVVTSAPASGAPPVGPGEATETPPPCRQKTSTARPKRRAPRGAAAPGPPAAPVPWPCSAGPVPAGPVPSGPVSAGPVPAGPVAASYADAGPGGVDPVYVVSSCGRGRDGACCEGSDEASLGESSSARAFREAAQYVAAREVVHLSDRLLQPPGLVGVRAQSPQPPEATENTHHGHVHDESQGHFHSQGQGHAHGHGHGHGGSSDRACSECSEDHTTHGHSHGDGCAHHCSEAADETGADVPHDTNLCQNDICCPSFGPGMEGELTEVRLNTHCNFVGHCVKMKNTFIHIPCGGFSDSDEEDCAVCRITRIRSRSCEGLLEMSKSRNSEMS